MNVGRIISEIVPVKANEPALYFKESHFTYGKINAIANSLANHLTGSGIRHKDNIAVILPNCPEFAFVYFASVKIGAIFTPIDTRLGEKDVNSILTDTNAKICFVYPDFPLIEKLNQSVRIIDITGEEFRSHINNPAEIKDIITEVNPDDTALYLHTSGTTGKPKIVELKSSNLDCFPEAMRDITELHENEIFGMVLPMSHISGPIFLNLLLIERCKLVIIDSINPNTVFENISKHRITFMHGVPPIFSLMLQSSLTERYDTSSLRLIAMMGTSVPVSLMNKFKMAFPHVTVLQGYGLTETSPLITLTKKEDADQKRASIGTPVEGAEVKVIDEEDNQLGAGRIGELIVKGPMVMKGYLNLPEENAQRIKNGYFYTRDLVKYDSDNYYYHMGRRDDLVVLANGLKVYPAEIKNIIFSHPSVVDSEVIGIHSEKEKGNILHAFIVPAQNAHLSENEIRSLCSEHLGSIKTPKKVTIIASIPKTSTGKANIQELKNLTGSNDT